MIQKVLTHRRPRVFERMTELVVAESTRHGGVSEFPFESLNLGWYAGDREEAVRENRRRFFSDLGISEEEVAGSHQVHGDKILKVEQPGRYKGYDALITDRRGLFLTVTVADCTPVLIYDPGRGAVGAVHAGWRGTVARIVARALKAMQEQFGTVPADCFAYVGTCIDECSYEVDADVAGHFGEAFRRWDEARGKFYLNLKGANKAQLLEAGVPEAQIELSPYSTVADNTDYFSYRQEKGSTGRMLALIGLAKR